MALPVSGLELRISEPTGEDEVCVVESAGSLNDVGLAIAARLVRVPSDDHLSTTEWAKLPAVDLAAAVMLIRRAWLGDVVEGEAACPAPACGAPVDIAFRVTEYLAHHRPRQPRGVTAGPAPDWYRVAGASATFRLPTVGDLLAVDHDADPAAALARRCIDPPGVPGTVRRRIERAMAALAPTLVDDVAGRCPACGHDVVLVFVPLRFVIAELRDLCASVYEDVHLLASRYGWSQDDVLRLPVRRRAAYADMVRSEARSA